MLHPMYSLPSISRTEQHSSVCSLTADRLMGSRRATKTGQYDRFFPEDDTLTICGVLKSNLIGGGT